MTFQREHHLLVKKTKKYHITTGWHSTNSKHFYYKSPNLIKDLVPTCAEQVFVNDITYVDIDGQHGYLTLVTDWFSKRIMGYKLDDNMRVALTKDALEMAVKNRIYTHREVIHHSDRWL